MFRKLLGVLGLAWLLGGDRLADATEQWASATDDVPDLRPWVVPAIRAEGALYVLLAWRGGRAYAAYKKLLGVLGLAALAYPREFVDYGTRGVYADPEECTWESWVYTVVRTAGLACVLLAADQLRRE